MNPLFYSGSFVVAGHPSYRVGKRLIYHDEIKKEKWEFYIEGVQHNFSRESGYTTTINVTRGLKIGGKVKRFQPIYGPPQEFKGGYLGELTLEELNEAGEAERESPGGSGDSSSDGSSGGSTTQSANEVMKKATDFGKSFADDKRGATAYHWGGGHGDTSNPLEKSAPYLLDCSGFVWWAYEHAGLRFDGGTNTTGIKASSNIKRKGTGLSISDLNYGDIVYFNNGSHIGMYVDGGKFVGWNGTGTYNYSMGCQIKPMDSGYWGNAWDRDAWVAQP